ncbi:MAG TPA: GNAT family N-acetyltransferase [Thermoanaerobaculia bacterium]|nr:GNAT family N-acetyltransferase [Thermoanaerobaculia bacterium]
MTANESPPYRIDPLSAHHDRAAFASGVEPLDRYLRTQAGQDSRRRVASCFVLTRADEPAQVLGYYTLSALSIALTDLPSAVAKRLPRYPVVPATLMGRLATDSRHRGKRLGELLLFDACARVLKSATFIARERYSRGPGVRTDPASPGAGQHRLATTSRPA